MCFWNIWTFPETHWNYIGKSATLKYITDVTTHKSSYDIDNCKLWIHWQYQCVIKLLGILSIWTFPETHWNWISCISHFEICYRRYKHIYVKGIKIEIDRDSQCVFEIFEHFPKRIETTLANQPLWNTLQMLQTYSSHSSYDIGNYKLWIHWQSQCVIKILWTLNIWTFPKTHWNWLGHISHHWNTLQRHRYISICKL